MYCVFVTSFTIDNITFICIRYALNSLLGINKRCIDKNVDYFRKSCQDPVPMLYYFVFDQRDGIMFGRGFPVVSRKFLGQIKQSRHDVDIISKRR